MYNTKLLCYIINYYVLILIYKYKYPGHSVKRQILQEHNNFNLIYCFFQIYRLAIQWLLFSELNVLGVDRFKHTMCICQRIYFEKRNVTFCFYNSTLFFTQYEWRSQTIAFPIIYRILKEKRLQLIKILDRLNVRFA